MGPSYDNPLSQWSGTEEDQIYEVLDGDENHPRKAKAMLGVNRSVTISGDKNEPYNKLEYSENSQSN